MSHFPDITGDNLLGEKIAIPGQLAGELNVVILAFEQWHQMLVDTWIPFLEQLVLQYPLLSYYELPTMTSMNRLYRGFINRGMRGGIPSRETRSRTITLYLDKDNFRRALEISDESDIHLLLVDKAGRIHWRAEGEATDENEEFLEAAVRSVLGSPRPEIL